MFATVFKFILDFESRKFTQSFDNAHSGLRLAEVICYRPANNCCKTCCCFIFLNITKKMQVFIMPHSLSFTQRFRTLKIQILLLHLRAYIDYRIYFVMI